MSKKLNDYMRSYYIGKDLKALKHCHKIQGIDGTWNYDEYMRGLYNGLELALSFFEKREPKFKVQGEKQ